MASTKRTISLNLPLLVVLASLIVVMHLTASDIGSATNMVQDPDSTSKEERELDDQIPRHLPIRVKLRKEKEAAFKNLKNENWLRDFELEVENTGDRPIFCIQLVMDFNGIAPYGNRTGQSLLYGRGNLMDFSEPRKPEDVPLKPGEIHVFRIAERFVKGWESVARDQGIPSSLPKKVVHFRRSILEMGLDSGIRRVHHFPEQNNPTADVEENSFARPHHSLCHCISDDGVATCPWWNQLAREGSASREAGRRRNRIPQKSCSGRPQLNIQRGKRVGGSDS
ncbi:MAG: hypothetical protein QOD75_2226 [Blastocatellia bacterium]|jgi:hypothetical protein|nr:hypothetical protein [Blastocatellia bacterium]